MRSLLAILISLVPSVLVAHPRYQEHDNLLRRSRPAAHPLFPCVGLWAQCFCFHRAHWEDEDEISFIHCNQCGRRWTV